MKINKTSVENLLPPQATAKGKQHKKDITMTT